MTGLPQYVGYGSPTDSVVSILCLCAYGVGQYDESIEAPSLLFYCLRGWRDLVLPFHTGHLSVCTGSYIGTLSNLRLLFLGSKLG